MSETTHPADPVAAGLMRHIAMLDARLLVLRDMVAALLGLAASPYDAPQQREIMSIIDGFVSERIAEVQQPPETNGRDGYGMALAADMRRDLDFILTQAKASLG